MTKKIGIVAGNFDVIHPGYVKLFEDAKTNACNYLIVALQGDPTIERSYKCKPVQTVEEREYILRSIKYVDDVLHYNMRGENDKGSIFCGDSVGNKVFYEKNEEDNTYDRGLWQFFTIWNSKNIIDFHNHIKKFLTPKGKAFINLYPFVYDRFENKFEKERDIFNQLGGVKSISMDSSQPCPSYEKYYILKNDEIT